MLIQSGKPQEGSKVPDFYTFFIKQYSRIWQQNIVMRQDGSTAVAGPCFLLRGPAAIDRQRGAGDLGGIVGAEKGH